MTDEPTTEERLVVLSMIMDRGVELGKMAQAGSVRNAFRAEVAVMEERWNALRKETGAA